MRINQMKGEREQGNLLLFGVFFLRQLWVFLFHLLLEPIASGNLKKDTVERKKTRSKTTQ